MVVPALCDRACCGCDGGLQIKKGQIMLTPVELDRLADALADRLASRLAAHVDADQLMDVHGAAALLSCSVPTIERMTRNGQLPSIKVGRLRRYGRTELLERLSMKESDYHVE